jgi:hypothetical protein
VRVHLAREHAHELELLDAPLDRRDIALDVAEPSLVALCLNQVEQLAAVAESRGDAVELRDRGLKARALSPEFLGPLGRVPDLRVLQFAVYFLEALALAVVLKGTP